MCPRCFALISRSPGTRSLLCAAASHPAILLAAPKDRADPGHNPGQSRRSLPAVLRRVRRAVLPLQRGRLPSWARRRTAFRPNRSKMLPEEERGAGSPVRLLIIDMRDAGAEVARFYRVTLRCDREGSDAAEEQRRLLRAHPAVPIDGANPDLIRFFSVNSAPFRFAAFNSGSFSLERRFIPRPTSLQ